MTMGSQSNHAQAIFELWEVLCRFRWHFIIPAFVFSTLLMASSLFLPRKYKAEATFERRTDMVLTEITNRGATRAFENPRHSITEEVAGQPAIDALVTTLEKRYKEQGAPQSVRQALDRARGELRQKVVVVHDIASNELDRVRVSYIGHHPVVARDIVNLLVESYIARSRSQMDQRLAQSGAFFDAEVERYRGLIEEIENEKLQFEIEHADLLPDQPQSVQTILAEVTPRLEEAVKEREVVAAQIQGLRKRLEQTPPTTTVAVSARNPELAQLETNLRELRNRLSEYRGTLKMTPRHPDIVALEQQIAEVQARIDALPATVVTQQQVAANPRRDELDLMLATAESQYESLTARVESLGAQVEAMNAEAANLFPIRSDYRKLIRRQEQAVRQLGFWEDNLRRVSMAAAAESGDRGIRMEFIKPSDPVTRPISPNLAQVFAAAIAVGLLAGGVSVFFAHRTDETFSDGDKLAESFELPLLGQVSEIISAGERRARRFRNRVVIPLNSLAMAGVTVFVASLVYLSLEKPQAFNRFTDQPAQFIVERLSSHSRTRPDAPPKE